MTKYKIVFKVKVVKKYLERNIGYKELVKKHFIQDKNTVRTWSNAYESKYYEGLKV